MNYSPEHMYVWDPWCMAAPDGVHLYHLQQPRSAEYEERARGLGHAFSTDLIHWETREPAFQPDPALPDDDLQPWTGCALWHDDRAWLFYTMRGSAVTESQAVGLAFSSDGNHFTRYRGNPVIVPDGRYFATYEVPVPGRRDCRDMHIVKAPDRDGWYGYFATRCPAPDLAHTSVIAAAYSPDLINWTQLPHPVFAPGRHACLEVPNVFQLGDKWFITCLTGAFYGSFGSFSDRNIYSGTIYAVADSPLGPFQEPEDNVVLGAMTGACPLAMRHLLFEGENYLIYTDREKVNRCDAGAPTVGTLSTPKLLDRDGDNLIVRYSDRVELLVKREIPLNYEYLRGEARQEDWGQIWRRPPVDANVGDGVITLNNSGAFTALPLGIQLESYIFEADISMKYAVSAGFLLHITSHFEGDFVRIDQSLPGVEYLGHIDMHPDFLERRQCRLSPNGECHFKVVVRKEHLEIYYNERLLSAFARYRGIGGGIGLFADRGSATFRNIRVRELE